LHLLTSYAYFPSAKSLTDRNFLKPDIAELIQPEH
jgi:hypothetical protein